MKMKKNAVLLALILMIFIPRLKAQETVIDEINYTQLEKFIQMAKDYYPQRRILAEQENIAKNSITISSLSYLDIVSASYFYRPDNVQTINPENPYITNGVQFGINISLGNFLQRPFQVKDAKSNYKISQLQKQSYDIELEKQVKTRYYDYVLKLKELKLKTVIAQDASGTFNDLTARFERGEITVEEYSNGRAALSETDSSKIQAEVDYLNAKDNLEAVIGVKLTDLK